MLQPIRAWAGKLEKRTSEKSKLVQGLVAEIDPTLSGEKRFNAVEKIYQAENYHPIQSLALGASLWVSLPILLAAIVVFSQSTFSVGQSFGMIKDLSQPDALVFGLNILPLLMTFLTLADARMRFRVYKQAQIKFLIVAVVLLALVYTMPAGLVLFWTGANLTAFFLFLFMQRH